MDEPFDLEEWNRQWAAVEAEMKAIELADEARDVLQMSNGSRLSPLITLGHPLRDRILRQSSTTDRFCVSVLVVAEMLLLTTHGDYAAIPGLQRDNRLM